MISRNEDMPVIPGREGVSERRPKHDPHMMNVEEWTYQPGVQFSGHAHDMPQVSYIAKGRLRLKQGDEEVELGPGCYFYTPPGFAHHITEIIEETTQIIFSPPLEDHHH